MCTRKRRNRPGLRAFGEGSEDKDDGGGGGGQRLRGEGRQGVRREVSGRGDWERRGRWLEKGGY